MMTLLSPFLLWGALLGIIPIIIHLLNRRRFRRVEWAPMHYLRLTIQRNRKRIQIEQLLLLLLRIALPIILFLFLARPILKPTGLERWIGGGGRTSQVILIDDSLSMGYAAGGPPAFNRAREVAGSLLSNAQPRDRCTLVAASAPRTPVFLEVEGTKREELASDALKVPQTETHNTWPSVLEGVDEVLRACTYPTKQLTIITDLRKSGWDPSVAKVARAWEEQGIRVRLVDVGAEESTNVAVESLTPLDRTVLAGTESRWEAVVRNDSSRVLTKAKAVLRVDDRPTEVSLPEIPPRQSAKVPFSVRFPSSGMHDLSIQLPEDELIGDNRRWAAVPVKDSLLIRMVDGEPSSEPFGSEVDYLAAPIAIGVGDAEAWRSEVVTEEDFLGPKLEPADVLVLANVASPTVDQADKLARLVRGGMGLLIFPGGKLDPGLYNDRLYRNEADRLLPTPFKTPKDEAIRGLVIEPVRPSPIEALLDLKASALERIPVRQIFGVDEPGESNLVRVLARWNDPAHSPAMVERVVGDGRVMAWTTTADRAWNDWAVEPSFVLAIREAIRGTSRPTSWANTVTSGDRPDKVVHSSQQLAKIQVAPPGGGEPVALVGAPVQETTSGETAPATRIVLADTRKAGLYRLSWDEGALGAQGDLFAANPDPRESALDRLDEPAVKKLLAPLEVEYVAARDDRQADQLGATGQEIWHEMAWALLAFLIFEPILACWVGRSR